MLIFIAPAIDTIVSMQSVIGPPDIQLCYEKRTVYYIFKIAIPFKHADTANDLKTFVVYGCESVSCGQTCSIAIGVSAELKGQIVYKDISNKLIGLSIS